MRHCPILDTSRMQCILPVIAMNQVATMLSIIKREPDAIRNPHTVTVYYASGTAHMVILSSEILCIS